MSQVRVLLAASIHPNHPLDVSFFFSKGSLFIPSMIKPGTVQDYHRKPHINHENVFTRIEMVSYRNPPVIEAVCEFRFPQDTQWPKDIADQLYERVKDVFPHKEIHRVQEIEIAAKEDKIGNRIIPIERITLQSEKPRIQLHIGNRILSIHCLQPYPSWEVFLPSIQLAFNTIQKITKITGIDRIGLLYLDKIEIPQGSGTLEEYFNFHPFLGESLPKNFVNFLVGCEFPFANMRDICRLQLTRRGTADGAAFRRGRGTQHLFSQLITILQNGR